MAKKISIARKPPVRKPPEMRCFIACDGTAQDPTVQKATLYGIFDRIYAQSFPTVFKPFSVFIKIKRGSGKIPEFVFRIFDAASKQIGNGVTIEQTTGKDPGVDIVVNVLALPISGPGRIKMTLEADGEKFGWPCELTVEKVQ